MQFAWHFHHDVLVEPLIGTDSLDARIAGIWFDKPIQERKTRLGLLKLVQGELPIALEQAGAAVDQAQTALDQAWTAYNHAWAAAAYHQARAALDQAWTAYYEARKENMPAILALHAQECSDCPWDGHTIFPEGGAA